MSAQILVIEDNAANLDLIMYLLVALGYRVASERDGRLGLQRAMSGNYDLVLTDVLMPGVDGYELVRRLKADPDHAHTPVVAVTALAMAGDREKILAAGFDGYISKPIEPRHFAAEVASFLAKGASGPSIDR